MTDKILFETHLHTKEGSSCATSSLEKQLAICNSEGIKVVAITDHNSIKAIKLYREQNLFSKFPNIMVLPGVEITISLPNGFAHILMYAKSENILEKIIQKNGFNSIDDFLVKIEGARDSLFLVWAHPGQSRSFVLQRLLPKKVLLKFKGLMRYVPENIKKFFFTNKENQLTVEDKKIIELVDAIEIINGGRGHINKRNRLVWDEVKNTHGLTGGSDTHFVLETGRALTVLEEDVNNINELWDILVNKKFHAVDLSTLLQKD